MPLRKQLLRGLGVLGLSACSSAFSGGANGWSNASDLLAVGLPALAAFTCVSIHMLSYGNNTASSLVVALVPGGLKFRMASATWSMIEPVLS